MVSGGEKILNDKNTTFKENIKHNSDNKPYSIHYTIACEKTNPVLYLHWHDEFEFLYVEKGEAIFVIEDKEYYICEGNAIFIPVMLLHTAKRVNNKSCSYFAFVFSPSLITESYTNSTYVRFIQPIKQNGIRYAIQLSEDVDWQHEILDLLQKIFLHIDDNISDWELFIHGSLFHIWHLLYQNHISYISLTNNYNNLTHKLSGSIDYIHEHYMDIITLSELASTAHICISVFCRYFKQLTGFTPFSYLIRYRIMRSCELLIKSDKKIADIATQCGFNNVSHYNREFQKFLKVTPSEYKSGSKPFEAY